MPFLVLLVTLLVSCTTNQDDYRKDRLIAEQVGGKSAPFTTKQGKFNDGKMFQAWRQCIPAAESRGSILLVYAPAQLATASCTDPHVQAFLKQGYSTIEMDEPLVAGATREYGNDSSISFFIKNIKSFNTPLVGLWSHGLATISGGRLAKKLSLSWLILAEGLYDMEVVKGAAVTHEGFKEALMDLEAKEGDAALEKRSLAWDYEGLPPLVYVYYADNSPQSIKDQSDDFAEVLAASQIRVRNRTFQAEGKPLDSQGHFTMIDDALSFFANELTSSPNASQN